MEEKTIGHGGFTGAMERGRDSGSSVEREMRRTVWTGEVEEDLFGGSISEDIVRMGRWR